uniref:PAS domain-containing protein n=1 Tax=Strigamia maritima TaxID=126957 RepID=T1JJ64_STRMM
FKQKVLLIKLRGCSYGALRDAVIVVTGGPSRPRTTAAVAMEVFEQHQGTHILQSLDGFAFALASDGRFLYISETVSIYLGLSQVEMTGSSVFDYIHQQDHAELAEQLGIALTQGQPYPSPGSTVSDEGSSSSTSLMTLGGNTAYKGLDRAFCIRMKSTLTKRGCHFKSSGFRVVLVLCHMRPQYTFSHNRKQSSTLMGMVALAIALPPPSVNEVRLESDMFVTRLTFDFKIAHCEPRVSELLDYTAEELTGKNMYILCHGEDVNKVRKCHLDLINKGQVMSSYYRVINKNGGYTWVQTCATVVCNSKTSEEQSIICVNYVLSGIEYEDCVMDTSQMVSQLQSRKPDDPSNDFSKTDSPDTDTDGKDGSDGPHRDPERSHSPHIRDDKSSEGTDDIQHISQRMGKKRPNRGQNGVQNSDTYIEQSSVDSMEQNGVEIVNEPENFSEKERIEDKGSEDEPSHHRRRLVTASVASSPPPCPSALNKKRRRKYHTQVDGSLTADGGAESAAESTSSRDGSGRELVLTRENSVKKALLSPAHTPSLSEGPSPKSSDGMDSNDSNAAHQQGRIWRKTGTSSGAVSSFSSYSDLNSGSAAGGNGTGGVGSGSASSSSVKELEDAMNKHLPLLKEPGMEAGAYSQQQRSTIQWIGAQQSPSLPASTLLRQLYANRESVIRSNVHATRPTYYAPDMQGTLPTPPANEPYPDQSQFVLPPKMAAAHVAAAADAAYPAAVLGGYASTPVTVSSYADAYNAMTPPSSVSPREKIHSSFGDGASYSDATAHLRHYSTSEAGTVQPLPLKPQVYTMHPGLDPSQYPGHPQQSLSAEQQQFYAHHSSSFHIYHPTANKAVPPGSYADSLKNGTASWYSQTNS